MIYASMTCFPRFWYLILVTKDLLFFNKLKYLTINFFEINIWSKFANIYFNIVPHIQFMC